MRSSRFEVFVALRYLFALRKQSFISIISLCAVCGVALGVAALIVGIGVMNGFSKDLRDKILGVNAHIIISSLSGGIRDAALVSETAARTPEVLGVTPFIYSEVMLSSPDGVKGVVLRGIDPRTAESVLSLDRDMVQGRVASLAEADPDGRPGIIVGNELAKRLSLSPGMQVSLLSPSGRQTAAGFQPKIRNFLVQGTFRTGMYEYDSSLGYVTVEAARDLLGYKGDFVSGLEVRIRDVDHAEQVSQALRKNLAGFPVYVRHWQEMNANLFAALKLEKTAMFVILALIVLVGSFSIVTTLVMLVMEKTRDIAILMSMGATRSMVRRIFMLQGTIIGAIGTALGYVLGLSV